LKIEISGLPVRFVETCCDYIRCTANTSGTPLDLVQGHLFKMRPYHQI